MKLSFLQEILLFLTVFILLFFFEKLIKGEHEKEMILINTSNLSKTRTVNSTKGHYQIEFMAIEYPGCIFTLYDDFLNVSDDLPGLFEALKRSENVSFHIRKSDSVNLYKESKINMYSLYVDSNHSISLPEVSKSEANKSSDYPKFFVLAIIILSIRRIFIWFKNPLPKTSYSTTKKKHKGILKKRK